jgi:hypothetical protein
VNLKYDETKAKAILEELFFREVDLNKSKNYSHSQIFVAVKNGRLAQDIFLRKLKFLKIYVSFIPAS